MMQNEMPQPAAEKSIREQVKGIIETMIALGLIGVHANGNTDEEKNTSVKNQLDAFAEATIKAVESRGITFVKREVIPGLDLSN